MVSLEAVRKRKKISIILISVGIILIFLICSLVLLASRPKYFSSQYTYDFSVETTAPLYNATFFFPIPIQNKSPQLGMKILTIDIFEKQGYSLDFVTLENITFVKISRGVVDPGQEHEYRVEARSGQNSQDSVELGNVINTRNPLGTEPVFLPKNNISTEQPVTASYLTWYGIHHNPVLSKYQTMIYADYYTTDKPTVEIYSRIYGTNSWAESGTWLENRYIDMYSLTLNGEAHGWHLADGQLTSGEGIYLN